MKKLLILILTLASLTAFAQVPALDDLVRNNPPSSAKTANALDASKSWATSGTDTYSITTSLGQYAGVLTYASGDMYTITIGNANTSTTVSLNVDTEGAVALKNNDGTDPDIGSLCAGCTFKFRHNGTNFRMIGSSGGGSEVTASNGLTKTDDDIALGGNVDETTSVIIAEDSFFELSSDPSSGTAPYVGIKINPDGLFGYGAEFQARPVADVLTDYATINVSSNAVSLGVAQASDLKQFLINPSDAVFTDGSVSKSGIKYNAAGYVTDSRSLTDKAYVDAKVADAINNGTTAIAPSQNAVFDALAPMALDRATPSTAGGTITLDMNSQIQRMHTGSASFATAKVIALSNTTNSLVFSFSFTVTDVAAVLTMPSDFVMSSPYWDGTDWTPPETGLFEMGGSFDGTNWIVKIAGPFN